MKNILFGIVRICRSLFKWYYLKNENFLYFLFLLWNLHQILEIFKEKIIAITNLFRKLKTVKNLVKPLSKKHSFRTSFDSQHVKGSQTLVKSGWEDLYHIFSSLWEEIIWKLSLLLKFENLGVLVNTLTADDKYPVWYCENSLFPIQKN